MEKTVPMTVGLGKRMIPARILTLLGLLFVTQSALGNKEENPKTDLTDAQPSVVVGKAIRRVRQKTLSVPARAAWLSDQGEADILVGDSQLWDRDQKPLLQDKELAVQATISSTDRLMSVQVKRSYDQAKEGYSDSKYVVFNRAGKVVFELKQVDGRLILSQASDGSFAIGRYSILELPSAPIRFTKGRADEIPQWPKTRHCLGVSIAPNSKWIAFTAGDDSPEEILLYGRDLVQLGRLPGAQFQQICDDSTCLMTYTGDRVRIYSNRGARVSEYALPGLLTETLVSVPNTNDFVAVFGGDELRRFERKTGKTIWSTKLSGQVLGLQAEDSSVQPLSIQMASSGKAIAIALRSEKKVRQKLKGWGEVTDVLPAHDSIALFDRQGGHISTLSLKGAPPPTSRLNYRLSADGRSITIRQGPQLVTYEVRE